MPTLDFSAARRHMVDSQIKPNKVTDERLLAAIGALPREPFLPRGLAGVAYVDEDIPLGGGRYLMEPMVFARLLQAADIRPQDLVLDIGCGTGYSAAVLCRLGGTVVALEEDKTLARRALEILPPLACDTVAVVEGKLSEGYPGQAPFDVIVIEGAVPEVPARILDQLAEGGRLVAVVRRGLAGQAMLYERRDGLLAGRVLFDASTPVLPGFAAPQGFVF